jgi:hypothetical protein
MTRVGSDPRVVACRDVFVGPSYLVVGGVEPLDRCGELSAHEVQRAPRRLQARSAHLLFVDTTSK